MFEKLTLLGGVSKVVPSELYHVSFDLSTRHQYFTPKVPYCPAESENSTVERVCCSETPEGAIRSTPFYWNKYLVSRKVQESLVLVYTLSTKGLEDKIVSPERLLADYNVYDSVDKGEYAILCSIPKENISLKAYQISEWSEPYDYDPTLVPFSKPLPSSEDMARKYGEDPQTLVFKGYASPLIPSIKRAVGMYPDLIDYISPNHDLRQIEEISFARHAGVHDFSGFKDTTHFQEMRELWVPYVTKVSVKDFIKDFRYLSSSV